MVSVEYFIMTLAIRGSLSLALDDQGRNDDVVQYVLCGYVYFEQGVSDTAKLCWRYDLGNCSFLDVARTVALIALCQSCVFSNAGLLIHLAVRISCVPLEISLASTPDPSALLRKNGQNL